ncbi:MAG: bifunctional folylpolyglutamate synthase/dihydrofolate synthase [Syntrophomonas sp.]|nr:bifunctional folylpolyglutamate synthase/dihydrofolate synthase [Syntrophomonas sp.]
MQELTTLGSRPGLERIESLLEEMGNPQQELKCVHVAGTNGKGSTSLIIADILIKAGYRVGRFSSPHLHSYFERFTIDGQEIGAEAFQSILDGIEKHIRVMLERDKLHPTEFEVLTAVAFQYFRDEGVDVAVLEVGMGGSYDSTNVIIPLVAVITGVDFDHTAYLGTSLEEIASNKAGIIKAGVPVVAGLMEEKAWRVVNNRARSMGAKLLESSQTRVSRVGNPNLQDQVINIEGIGISMQGVRFTLRGDYQLQNLATALTALQIIKEKGYRVEEQSIRGSLLNLKMPGRLEVIQQNPLVIADAAHNPQGAKALADSLDTLLPDRKKVLVLGLVNDKERDGIIQALGRNTRSAVVTRPQGPRGSAWKEVKARWQQVFPDIPVVEVESIPGAVARGLEMMQKDDYMVVTGSFYVLDQARRIFINLQGC